VYSVVESLLRAGFAARLVTWALLGAIVGVGLMNKHSMAFYAFALLAGVIAVNRERLRARELAIAIGVAVLIVLPHAVWQLNNDFPMLELLRNGKLHKNAPFSLIGFIGGQFLEQHPLTAPIWIAGLVALFRRGPRALAVAHVVIFLLFVALEAKVYYLAPAYPILFAAGGAANKIG
jgi:4-amino-4-deoxy-L-arabinose transferase-like glycosyltransferase